MPQPGRVWLPAGLTTPPVAPDFSLPAGLTVRSPRPRIAGRIWLPAGVPTAPTAITAGLPPGLRVSSPRRLIPGRVLKPRLPAAGLILPPVRIARLLAAPRRGSVWMPRLLIPTAAPTAYTAFSGLTVRAASRPRDGWAWLPRPVYGPYQLGRFAGAMLVRRTAEDRARRRRGWLLHWLPIPMEGAVPPSGYNVYGNSGSGPIDYSSPIATVYGTTWTSDALAYPDTWRFGVRAFNAYGEEQNLDAAVAIILDASGTDITLRPSPPVGLRAFALAGGDVRVEWGYPVLNRATVPTGFHVYIGTGGAPDYGSPAATVALAAGIADVFIADLTGLVGRTTYQVGVRAFNSVAEEPNTGFVSVTADSAGPDAVDSLTATAV